MNSRIALTSEVCAESKRLYLEAYTRTQSEGLRLGDINDQVLRSLLSVGSNWAEAFGRRGTRERRMFATMARGSGYEAAFQLNVLGWNDLEDRLHVICFLMEDVVNDLSNEVANEKIRSNGRTPGRQSATIRTEPAASGASLPVTPSAAPGEATRTASEETDPHDF